jgi:hypothetical protein
MTGRPRGAEKPAPRANIRPGPLNPLGRVPARFVGMLASPARQHRRRIFVTITVTTTSGNTDKQKASSPPTSDETIN